MFDTMPDISVTGVTVTPSVSSAPATPVVTEAVPLFERPQSSPFEQPMASGDKNDQVAEAFQNAFVAVAERSNGTADQSIRGETPRVRDVAAATVPDASRVGESATTVPDASRVGESSGGAAGMGFRGETPRVRDVAAATVPDASRVGESSGGAADLGLRGETPRVRDVAAATVPDASRVGESSGGAAGLGFRGETPRVRDLAAATVPDASRVGESSGGVAGLGFRGETPRVRDVAAATRGETPRIRDLADDELETPQALPETAAVPVTAVQPMNVPTAADAVSAVGARGSAETPVKASDILTEAVTAVADTMLVTPGLLRGEGEIRVQLKPEVLDGTEVRIAVNGKSVAVEFHPTTDAVSRLLFAGQTELVQQLSAKIQAFDFNVTVAQVGGKSGGRRTVRAGDEVV